MDNATPSGTGMAATALARLGALTGEARWTEIARSSLQSVRSLIEQYPTAAGQSLIALDFLLSTPEEFAVVGGKNLDEFDQVLDLLYGRFLPHRIVAPSKDANELASIPLLSDRAARGGVVTTYLCRHNTCEVPYIGVDAMRAR